MGQHVASPDRRIAPRCVTIFGRRARRWLGAGRAAPERPAIRQEPVGVDVCRQEPMATGRAPPEGMLGSIDSVETCRFPRGAARALRFDLQPTDPRLVLRSHLGEGGRGCGVQLKAKPPRQPEGRGPFPVILHRFRSRCYRPVTAKPVGRRRKRVASSTETGTIRP